MEELRTRLMRNTQLSSAQEPDFDIVVAATKARVEPDEEETENDGGEEGVVGYATE